MGVVAMEVTDFFLSRGYSHVTRAIYVYCDACGSFRVRKTLSPRQWGLVIVGVLGLGYLISLGAAKEVVVFAGFIYLVLSNEWWGFPRYRCKKCGQATTVRYNTRKYPSDKSIVDVPQDQVEKFYYGHWPDEGELSDYLDPPAHWK